MSLNGSVSNITIKDDTDHDNICKFSNVKLQLTKNNPKLIIKNPPDNEIVGEFYLKDCSYLEKSSVPGSIECVRINSQRRTLIITDKNKQCEELLKYMRDYLMKPPSDDEFEPEPEPGPVSNEKVNQLIRALNESNADGAARIARQLAQEKASVRFGLDMINESGNAPPVQPPQPVEEPLKLKLTIESYLINQCVDNQFDVAILRGTTIKDLKQIVQRDAGINPNQQYWYIKREHIIDTYVFGTTIPRVDENTVLVLYITKPETTQNT